MALGKFLLKQRCDVNTTVLNVLLGNFRVDDQHQREETFRQEIFMRNTLSNDY